MTNLPAYPRGWFTVHAGLSRYVHNRIGNEVAGHFQIPFLPNSVQVRYMTDEDDWNVWGEPPEGQTRHVQWVTPFLAVALDLNTYLVQNYADDLVPVATGEDSHILTAVSGSEDWASSTDLETLVQRNDWALSEDEQQRYTRP